MKKQKEEHFYISDSGLMEDNNTKQARRFVFMCNVVTLVLAVLGLIVFIEGNF